MTRSPGRGVGIHSLATALVAIFALDNVLLLAFLGRPSWVIALASTGAAGLTILLSLPRIRTGPFATIPVTSLMLCFAIAVVLLILGGEGRYLYANFDWQVRDALLADMARSPWPYAYSIDGQPHVLRAPIGMYLIPALLGQGGQQARDAALLVSNSVVLGSMLALAATLFDDRRKRMIALGVFVLFSGLDIVGTLVVAAFGATPSFDHLERWMDNLQYSSTLTQIFWVPQHAFAGWACALFYLLWRQRRLGAVWFVCIVPLTALWSPLALIGAMPFVAFAAVPLIATRQIGLPMIAGGALSLGIALPALAYLTSGAATLDTGVQAAPLIHYLLFIVVEVGLYLALVWASRSRAAFDAPTFWIAGVSLLIIPFYHIDAGTDFVMRASIVPLAILACFVARSLTSGIQANRAHVALIAVLLIGSVTGLKELTRTFGLLPSPAPQCSLLEVWHRQSERVAPYGTYWAPLAAIPALIRPDAPTIVASATADRRCWSRDWVTAR